MRKEFKNNNDKFIVDKKGDNRVIIYRNGDTEEIIPLNNLYLLEDIVIPGWVTERGNIILPLPKAFRTRIRETVGKNWIQKLKSSMTDYDRRVEYNSGDHIFDCRDSSKSSRSKWLLLRDIEPAEIKQDVIQKPDIDTLIALEFAKEARISRRARKL